MLAHRILTENWYNNSTSKSDLNRIRNLNRISQFFKKCNAWRRKLPKTYKNISFRQYGEATELGSNEIQRFRYKICEVSLISIHCCRQLTENRLNPPLTLRFWAEGLGVGGTSDLREGVNKLLKARTKRRVQWLYRCRQAQMPLPRTGSRWCQPIP